MANRIKGLTVEIDGSTTGLDKALKNVNTTIKGTQTQLKDVQKLLKLDPSNTELLSQKQRLLKEAIGATKDKLDSLKTAQEQAKKQLEEGTLGQDKYDALQREIEETEQALKQLESQVSTTYATARYNATEATAVSATTATTAELTNTYMQDTGDLELTKKIAGQGADPDEEFLFTISLTAPSGTTLADEYIFKKGGETATGITYIKSAENNKATITGIKLKGDEKFTIEGLPAGTNYIIAESDYSQDGYSASTTQGNLEGTIPGGANAKASVEVTNTHITGTLTVEKTVSGTGASTADAFDFKVTIVRQNNASGRHGKYVIGETEYPVNFTNGTAVVEFKLKGGEQAVFSEIQKNATFTLEELSADQNGYVTSVTSTGGTIEGKKVTGTFSNETAITASYVNSKQSVTLDILKVEKNSTKKLENAVFELNQIEADKTTISTISGTTQTATTNDEGEAQFPNLTNGFYEIVEKNPPAGYVLTENAKFYIEVTDDGINLVTRVDNTKPSEWTTKNAVYGIVKDFAVATDIANAKATIENEPGAALPNTGGPGTRIFTILGSILILGAGVLLWRRRRTI